MTTVDATITLTQGAPTADMTPQSLIVDAVASAHRQYDMAMMRYGNAQGFAPLRHWLATQFESDPDQFIIGNGSINLLAMLTEHYIRENDVVLVENPTYYRAKVLFEAVGAQVIPISLDVDGMDTDRLANIIERHTPKLLYIVPDFHNPTGITTSLEKRQAIAHLAQKNDVLIYEDNAYWSLRYAGTPLPQVRTFAPEHTITSGSFSKLLTPALRTGWIHIPKAIKATLMQYIENRTISPNFFSQATIAAIVQQPQYVQHIAHLRKIYLKRRNHALQTLDHYLATLDATWTQPDGGFFIGLWLPRTKRPIWEVARENGLVVINGDKFFVDKPGQDFVRLPFCSVDEERFRIGIQRLAQAYQ